MEISSKHLEKETNNSLATLDVFFERGNNFLMYKKGDLE